MHWQHHARSRRAASASDETQRSTSRRSTDTAGRAVCGSGVEGGIARTDTMAAQRRLATISIRFCRRRRSLPPNTYKEPEKPLVKPQQPGAPIAATTSTQQSFPSGSSPRVATPAAPVLRDSVAPPAPPADASAKESEAKIAAIGPDTPGSKLWVGPKIKLKGVEISDCDVLVVEGEVEATVNSKAMQIAQPGTLKGHVN